MRVSRRVPAAAILLVMICEVRGGKGETVGAQGVAVAEMGLVRVYWIIQ